MNDIYEEGLQLWARWTEMWNGRTALAREIAGERFVLHLTLPKLIDPATVNDPPSVERWVIAHRARVSPRFHYEAGPFVDTVARVVAGPWWADLVVDGKPGLACGMDTIAFRDGKITEYWTLSQGVETVGVWTTAVAARRRLQRGPGDVRR
jgi:hypothetical protein